MVDTIVTAPGSLGDVNPLIAIARGLAAEGRSVVVSAAERYLPIIQRAGLDTHALVSENDFARVVHNPDIWHPRKGLKLVLQSMGADQVRRQYHWIESLYKPGKTLLVSHVLDFAGRIFREAHPEVAYCCALPEPVLLRSLSAPPRLTEHGLETRAPRWLLKAFYRLADSLVDRMLAPALNPLRRSLGLPPLHRVMDKWWASPELTLGLFPDWFTVPPEDWPAGFQCTGFPLADSGDLLSEDGEKLVDHALAPLGNERPIVFAPGSAHAHARSFLAAGAQACRQLGLPGVLLSSVPDQFPKDLPSRVVTARYLPFRLLMQRARAVVHHGGIGTTSQTLAAGLPHVVCPMGFDQFDNGAIVQRLGCGRVLPMRRVTASRLQALLAELLENERVAAAAAAYAGQVQSGWASPAKLAKSVLKIA